MLVDGLRTHRNGEGKMTRIARAVAVASLAFVFSTEVSSSNAAMGLRCSDWINARSWVRFDEATQLYVPANPTNARPVTPEVDQKSSLAIYYVSGIVETYMRLDPPLNKITEIAGLHQVPTPSVNVFLDLVEQDCRSGLQKELRDYDVLDLISQQNEFLAMMRSMLVQEITSKALDAGEANARRR